MSDFKCGGCNAPVYRCGDICLRCRHSIKVPVEPKEFRTYTCTRQSCEQYNVPHVCPDQGTKTKCQWCKTPVSVSPKHDANGTL